MAKKDKPKTDKAEKTEEVKTEVSGTTDTLFDKEGQEIPPSTPAEPEELKEGEAPETAAAEQQQAQEEVAEKLADKPGEVVNGGLEVQEPEKHQEVASPGTKEMEKALEGDYHKDAPTYENLVSWKLLCPNSFSCLEVLDLPVDPQANPAETLISINEWAGGSKAVRIDRKNDMICAIDEKADPVVYLERK